MSCKEIRPELFALGRGELGSDDEARVRRHLRRCGACRADMQELQRTAELVVALAPPAPPARLRTTVLAAVETLRTGDVVRAAISAVPDEGMRARILQNVRASAALPADVVPLRRNRVTPREMMLVAAAVAALGFAVFTRVSVTDPPDRGRRQPPREASGVPEGHPQQNFVLAGSAASIDGTLTHYRSDNFRLTLDVGGLPVTEPDHQYAVWLTGARGDVPLGGFRLKKEDDFSVNFAVAVDPVEYPTVLVTLEPDDGDPRRSGEVVLEGELDPSKVHHGPYDD